MTDVNVDGERLKALHSALIDAFPSPDALSRMVQFELNANLHAITGQGNLNEIVYGLLKWALAQGRLSELIRKANASNPDNYNLKTFAKDYFSAIDIYLQSVIIEMQSIIYQTLSLSTRQTRSAVEPSPKILRYIITPHLLFDKPTLSETATEEAVFDNFQDAFEKLGKRVLLLGIPGAGKTTTLLQFACHAAQARLLDPTKPIPLFASIHRWDQKTPLQQWVQTPIRAEFPGIILDDQPLLYIFDGLDELQEEEPVDPNKLDGVKYDPRERFLHLVEDQLSKAEIVISCRELEYHQIKKKATLQGAVTLLPLAPQQIQNFLLARNQPNLWQNLTADMNLLELSRTPLLLALISLAVGADDIKLELKFSYLTATSIFDFYMKQRIIHEIRKRDLPFDERTIRELLGKLGAFMWIRGWTPLTEVNFSTVEQFFGNEAQRFLSSMISMHFLQQLSSGMVMFIHSKFRDYCAIPGLLEALTNREVSIREIAVEALGKIGDASAIPDLLEALKDDKWEVRVRVVVALGKIGDASAIPGLLEVLRDKEWTMRDSAIVALEKIGDASAIPGLLKALKEEDWEVRISASEALGKIRDASAIPGLLKALKDEEWTVRVIASEALGKIRDVSAIPGLLEALGDDELEVRESAAEALRYIGVAAIPGLLEALKDGELEVRESAATTLGKIGDVSAIPGFLRALKDEEWTVRVISADALSKIGDVSAIPGLLKALEDADEYVKISASEILGKIGDVSAIPGLLKALKDEEWTVRMSASEALGKIGDVSAIPGLLEALKDEEWAVRESAAVAIGRLKH